MKHFFLAVLALLLAGCAAPAASPAAPAPSSSPPRTPSDQIKNPGYVVGTVTAGGSGPCYSLSTDDGTVYALHAADGTTLVKGARMRVTFKPALAKIGCGPGKLVEMTAAEPLR
jgi:hypothetical protein